MDQITNYGLTETREEKYAADSFINPLPRAVLRSNKFILLDGEWCFALDADDKGLQEGWHLGQFRT